MSKKRRKTTPPPPGPERFEIGGTVYPVYPEGTPPPMSILGSGPNGEQIVIWKATEAEPTPPSSLWPPPRPTR